MLVADKDGVLAHESIGPNEEQLSRLAKSYKPKANRVGLEKTVLQMLQYKNLTDHTYRYPMPAGGLFSTATDLAKFYRMLLKGALAKMFSAARFWKILGRNKFIRT